MTCHNFISSPLYTPLETLRSETQFISMAPLYESCHNLRMETMYNTTCMAAKMALSSKVNEKQPDVCFQCFLFKLVASMGILFLVNLNYEILKINISKETSLCR